MALVVAAATIALDVAVGAVGLAVLVAIAAAVAPVAAVVAPIVIAPVVTPIAASTVAVELAAIRLLVTAIETGASLVAVPVGAVLAGLRVGTGLAVPALAGAALAVPSITVAALPVPVGMALPVGTVAADLPLRAEIGALRALALVGHGGAVGALLLEGLSVRTWAPIATILTLAPVGTLALVTAVLVDLLRGRGRCHHGCRHQRGSRHQEFEKLARHRRRPRLPAHEPAPHDVSGLVDLVCGEAEWVRQRLDRFSCGAGGS
ncbi:hypothetical protein NHF48_008905 [Sphingomonas sp. H160509]|uniref:hypothetical protein n=1 Tax=Sphingomonas sp. H160509 TaxID=2955313 RepID=UPI002096C39E|nr:hypothetical protein [Sphingomonas sp. H160509]MDD1451055.1 hypothetical protein [Sphingomonas sp. H160509]